ncbi:MAG: polymer-forming cytoskeletal protein [Gammaproteobacteria bacterium]
MFGRGKAPRLSGRIDTLLGRGTSLKGDLEFSGGLHVDGSLHGHIRGLEGSTPATLWVGEPGKVHGDIEVAVAVINGEVVGNVRGRERVVLGAKARVTGDVSYGIIEMTLGARIEGKLVPLASMSQGESAAQPAEAPRSDNVLRPFDLRQGRN